MADIITDLQNATTGTRELDARLWIEMSTTRRLASNEDAEYGVVQILSEQDGQWRYASAPGFTTASKGLRILMDYVRERWPDNGLDVYWSNRHQEWCAHICADRDDFADTHPTDPAIALAIAILRAKENTND